MPYTRSCKAFRAYPRIAYATQNIPEVLNCTILKATTQSHDKCLKKRNLYTRSLLWL